MGLQATARGKKKKKLSLGNSYAMVQYCWRGQRS